MKNLIAQVMTEQAYETLPVISLEEEIDHIEKSEEVRTAINAEVGDSTRTMELITALESLALVADTIRQPTQQEAALIQIAGDTALAGTGLSGGEITPSMEDNASGVSVSAKVRTAIEQIVKALKELLARVAAMVRKYVQHARAAAGGHVQRQKVIKERLMKASHSLNTENEITVSMPVADGKTLTSLSEVLDEALKFSVVVDWFIKSGTTFNIDYASGFVDLFAKLGDGEKGIGVVEQFAILNKMADQTSHTAQGVPHGHVKDDTDKDYFSIKTVQTVQLLGGVSIAITAAKPIAHNTGLSSASIGHAIEELTKVGIKVTTESGGFYKEAFRTKPLNQAELHRAFDLANVLIEHFTAKSDHTALAAATARRSEFAEVAVDHLTRYADKFKKNDLAAKEFGRSALHVGQSIMASATAPYTQMTTATSRVITLLQNAMLKSLNEHEGAHDAGEHTREYAHGEMAAHIDGVSLGKAKPSNESVDELVYSAEGFFGDVIGGIKKALGIRKPTKLNLQKIASGYHDLKELRRKVEKNYVQTVHETDSGEIAAGNITPYLFAYKGSQDPSKIASEWKAALHSAHAPMLTLADMMSKSGMEAYAIFKKYHGMEKSVENLKKMDAEFGQYLRKWGAPSKPNLVGVLKNFQLDDLSLLGKNPDIAMWDQRRAWTMGELRPAIEAAAHGGKLPRLTPEQIPEIGRAMIEAIDFLMNHQVQSLLDDSDETLMNIEYGHEIVLYDYEWIEDKIAANQMTEHDISNAWTVESAGDQYEFLYFSMMLEYFSAIISMILAADRWVSASIKD